MAETQLDIRPASQYALLVTFTHGTSGVVHRYAKWTNNISVGSETFLAAPEIEVELGLEHGGTEDKPHKITIGSDRSPMTNMLLGFRHASVNVVVEHIDPSAPSTRRHLGKGSIANLTRNPNGRPGLVRLSVTTVKSKFADVHLGIQATTACDNEFGNGPYTPCRLDYSSWIRSGSVSSVQVPDRNIILLTLPSVADPVNELPNERFRRGFIDIDGLKLPIKRSLQNKSFELFCVPAPYLVGMSCSVVPGCDGRLSSCRIWGNEINFNGVGIKTPSRNPVFESSQ